MGLLVLSEFLARIDEFEAHLVAFVPRDSEPTGDSEVVLVDYQRPKTPIPDGTRYSLGVQDIRDVIETWSKWRDGRMPGVDERVEAVVFYANNDGYLPV